jgi:uncharacterized cupredoxin-like copper-binding protein
MRSVLQSLGSTVAWDTSTLTAIGQNQEPIRVQLSNRQAMAGEREITLAAAPMLIEDRVYVPMDFLKEALGAEVAWDQGERMVDIATLGPAVAGYRSRPQAQAQPMPEAQPAPVRPQPQASTPPTPQAADPLPSAEPSQPVAKAPATVVKVTLEEYKITLDPSRAPAGPITLQIYNAGRHKHGLDIESTDIKSGVLEPGHSVTLNLNLQPNTYTLYCPVDGHREMGMKVRLEVQ